MGLQERPVCWKCDEPIQDNNFVFCAPCDHDECPSVVFHPLCLMDWRQHREESEGRKARWLDEHIVQVGIRITRKDGGPIDPDDLPPGFPRE